MRYDKKQIDQWISEWEQSGLSISRYCIGKPFDKSSFYNWRKKLQGTSSRKNKGKFMVVEPSVGFLPYVSLHYPNGVRLDVHVPMNIDEVKKLVGC